MVFEYSARADFITYKPYSCQIAYQRLKAMALYNTNMKEVTPTCYQADHFCVDCGKGISPHQARVARNSTRMSRALGDSRNREGFTLCRACLDRETRESRALIDTRSWRNNYTPSTEV